MFIYIFISLILTGLAIINPKNEILKKSIYLLLGIFLCTSYFNGSDWRQYEVMYKLATFEDISSFYAEKGFYIYMCIFKTLGFTFFEFFIVTKFIIYYIFYKILIKSSNFYLVLNIFYYQMALFLFVDCPLRNLIAIGLVLLGIEYLKKGRKKVFFSYVILATTFHSTAIFFIIIPLIFKVKKLSRLNIIIVLMLLYILFLNQNILLKVLRYLPFFEKRLLKFIGTELAEGKIMSIGNIEKLVIVISLVILRLKNKIYRENLILTLMYFLLYRIAITFPILFRLALYLQIFYIMGIELVVEKLKLNVKIIVISLFGIYSILNIYKITNNTYKYIPYTSYLKYIGKEKPSYNYRNKYNFIKWSERTGKTIEELRRN
ncbi:MAG: EpsG family protein [Fusobacterium mortiferum]|nr:EpsG family protein [Fusobacterium mortiferum]